MRKRKRVMNRIVAAALAAVMAMGIFLMPLSEAHQASAAGITPVKINAANFPDPIFRAVISGPTYDKNGNGTLDYTEIRDTLNVYCEGLGIKSIKGVEYFVNLQGLWCKDNAIESMDIRALTDLRGLWCSNNKLKSLDLSNNKELVWVYCYDCQLTALDVSHNPKMAFIECNTNPITSLDLSHNPELEHLTCGSCKLKTLDLSHNPKLAHLDAFRNQFKTLDVTKNPKMKRLDIWDNENLGTIDISKCPELQYYNCANNGVTKLDVSTNPELQRLICSYNELKTLDLSHNPKLASLNCEDNQLTKLDLSNNPQLRYLQAAINSFTTLNIGDNPFLLKTYREGTFTQEWFGRSWTINYGGDDSTGGDNMFYLWINDGVTVKTTPTKTVAYEEKYSELDPGVSVNDLIKREEAVKILYELAGSPSVSGLKTRFTDVKAGTLYYNALLWGEKNSICVGYPYTASDSFGVGKWLTRQDMLLMLMRYSEYKGYKRAIDFGRADDYMDYLEVDYDHWEAVTWSATWGILMPKSQPGIPWDAQHIDPDTPKEELRIDPYGRVSTNEFQKVIDRMLEVNSAVRPLEIDSHPQDVAAKAGTQATFSVGAHGSRAVQYQWQAYNPSTKTWVNSSAAGAKTAKLTLTVASAHNGFLFRCIVSDIEGTRKTTNAAKLTVFEIPSITKQPAAKTVPVGGEAAFSVTAKGTGQLSYRWQVYNPNTQKWTNSPAESAKTPNYSLTAQIAHQGFKFRCVVSDNYGNSVTSNAVTLTVRPGLTAQPNNASVVTGAEARFTIGAKGCGTLSYQWQVWDAATETWKNSASASAKTATFAFTAQTGHNGKQFRCIVTDANGNKTQSRAVKLTVNPAITAQPSGKTVPVGGTAEFTVAAKGAGTLKYQWQVYNPNTQQWFNSSSATAKTATFSLTAQAAHQGFKFRCVVTDANGNKTTSSAALLSVRPGIVTQPKDVTVANGGTVKLTITAKSAGTLSYQWQVWDTATETWKNSMAASAKTATFTFTAQKGHNGKKFRCVLTDSYGHQTVSRGATVMVQ